MLCRASGDPLVRSTQVAGSVATADEFIVADNQSIRWMRSDPTSKATLSRFGPLGMGQNAAEEPRRSASKLASTFKRTGGCR